MHRLGCNTTSKRNHLPGPPPMHQESTMQGSDHQGHNNNTYRVNKQELKWSITRKLRSYKNCYLTIAPKSVAPETLTRITTTRVIKNCKPLIHVVQNEFCLFKETTLLVVVYVCVCVCVSGILCQTDVCYTLVHPSSWWSRSLRWSQLDGVGNHILTRKQMQKINAVTNRQLKDIHKMSHKQP